MAPGPLRQALRPGGLTVYRTRVENLLGDRWTIATKTARAAVEIAEIQHAEIVWMRRVKESR